ncbi:hypothetical protein AB0J83_22975 [Actinoplanes sp. NPDC049596]|uniref:hypothetical protein n=1 Tax=unclassified Actinoplanes TaxID=2626549 RepID=UPI00341A69BB
MTDAPVEALTAPVAEAPIPDLVNNILGGGQYIRPSYWLGWAMEKVCSVKPWGWIAEQLAGDRNDAAEASSAITNLAECNTRYGDTINQAAETHIPNEWDGNAALAAHTYFTQLAQDLQALVVAALKDIAGEFRSLAVGIEKMAQSLQTLCRDLLDWLIAIGISAAAAAASSWTVVGGVTGAAATAASIWEAVKVWYLIPDAHDAAWAAVQGFVGLTAAHLGAIHGMDHITLPATAYNHPGV